MLTGRGAFTDDIRMHGVTYAAVLRSPHAHARIRSIERGAIKNVEIG
jgi:aerobic carbon-monoxide dehydrogenase large subunit